MARPTIYSSEAVDAICDRIAAGESLRAVCTDPAMPSRASVTRWLDLHPDFAAAYALACQSRADDLFDEILEIADTPEEGIKTKTSPDGKVETTIGDMIEHRRLQVEARKWVLARLAPKKYGDRQQLEHTGADGKDLPEPVTFVAVYPAASN